MHGVLWTVSYSWPDSRRLSRRADEKSGRPLSAPRRDQTRQRTNLGQAGNSSTRPDLRIIRARDQGRTTSARRTSCLTKRHRHTCWRLIPFSSFFPRFPPFFSLCFLCSPSFFKNFISLFFPFSPLSFVLSFFLPFSTLFPLFFLFLVFSLLFFPFLFHLFYFFHCLFLRFSVVFSFFFFFFFLFFLFCFSCFSFLLLFFSLFPFYLFFFFSQFLNFLILPTFYAVYGVFF